MRQRICVPVEVLTGEELKNRAGYGRREAVGKYLERVWNTNLDYTGRH